MRINATSSQSGVGMIEVLIALIVLSIGFLAAASMQVQSMRTNQLANQQAIAMVLLNDMMDRMSANPDGVLAGSYDDVSTGTKTAVTCASTGCTPAQIAAVDLFDWSANFESLRGESVFLPALPPDAAGIPATGTVSAPVAGVYTLALNWDGWAGTSVVPESLTVSFVP